MLLEKPKQQLKALPAMQTRTKTKLTSSNSDFGTLTSSSPTFLEKLTTYRSRTTSSLWTVVNFSTCINTMGKTLRELVFEAVLRSATTLKHATDKLV